MSFDPTTMRALEILPSYRVFREKYKLLEKSQWWNEEQIQAFQLQQLKKLLTNAFENVPFYTNIFNRIRLSPRDIRDLEDVEQLPFLTKEIVRENSDALKARNYPPRKFERTATGGSTGIPLALYYEKGVSRAREWAFIRTLWGRVGYKFTDKCVILRGNVVEGVEKGIYWKSALLGRWLILSSYHLSDATMPSYIAKIKAFAPKFIWAYPSTITLLASYMQKHKVEPFPTLKALLCGSENVYPWQRNLLEQVFRCRLFSWYGLTEMGALAGECEINTEYHIFPEYGLTELIDNNGTVVRDANVQGEIVTTGFNNPVFPLIRYKTGDFGAYGEGGCACKRSYKRLQTVEGRWLQELIVGQNSEVFPVTALNMHSDVYDNVAQFQFYQDREGELTLNIVKGARYTEADSRRIRRELVEKLGTDMRLELEYVDCINRTPAGKFRFVVQKLPVDKLIGNRR